MLKAADIWSIGAMLVFMVKNVTLCPSSTLFHDYSDDESQYAPADAVADLFSYSVPESDFAQACRSIMKNTFAEQRSVTIERVESAVATLKAAVPGQIHIEVEPTLTPTFPRLIMEM